MPQADRLIAEKIRDDIKENSTPSAEQIVEEVNSKEIVRRYCKICKTTTMHKSWRCMRCS